MKRYLFLTAIAVALVYYSCETRHRNDYISLQGEALGTFYSITYNCPKNKDYHSEIRTLYRQMERSMSIYDPESVISVINESETGGETDSLFRKVFKKSLEISRLTGNAFDITVAPLVNAWGFGTTSPMDPGPAEIDSILEFVGIEKVRLEGEILVKDDPRVRLDMNAIAKGYMTDLVAGFLESMGVENYMVEVGGELRLSGRNPDGNLWRIGVDKPVDDPAPAGRELQVIIHITDRAIATSGSYRRFFIKDGRRYSHTIDPHTGYPVDHNLLSVTVITGTAMEADAWATAFMVMGLAESLEMAEKNENLEAYFIYESDSGKLEVEYTEGFSGWMRETPPEGKPEEELPEPVEK